MPPSLVNIFFDESIEKALISSSSGCGFFLFGVCKKINNVYLLNVMGCKSIYSHQDVPLPPKSISLLGYACSGQGVLPKKLLSSSLFLFLNINSQVTFSELFLKGESLSDVAISWIAYDAYSLSSAQLWHQWSFSEADSHSTFKFFHDSFRVFSKQFHLLKRMQVNTYVRQAIIDVQKNENLTDNEFYETTRVDSLVHSLNFSSAIQHLWFRFDQLKKCLTGSENSKHRLKIRNTLSSILFDIFLGTLLICTITTFLNTFLWLDWGLLKMEKLADRVEELINLLIGMPVGLKLNRPLNSALGNFFLYHIHIWKTYMILMRPFLLFILDIFTFSGVLGASFMLALLSDLFSVASIHIYCFYGYAARLHAFQLSGLIALWRLFRGKKWNTLKKRVDSYHYTSDQLFIGSVCFTTLIFLSPTILLYYVVFFTLRITILFNHIITQLIIGNLVQVPIYEIISWLRKVPSTLQCFEFRIEKTNNSCVRFKLVLQPIPFTSLFREDHYYGNNPFYLRKLVPENFFLSLIRGGLI